MKRGGEMSVHPRNRKPVISGTAYTRREVLGGMGVMFAAGTLPDSPIMAQLAPAVPDSTPQTGQTLLYGHRGALMYAPENTLPAFELCLIAGCGFEIDFYELKDGEIIALHDGTFNRTTDTKTANDQAALRDLDYVKRLDAGSWFHPDFAGTRIPTLPEVCELIRRRARGESVVMLMDIKILTDNFLARVKAEFEKTPTLFSRVLFRVDTIAMAQRIKACDTRFSCVKSGNETTLAREVLNSPLFDGIWTGSTSNLAEIRKAGKSSYMTLFNRPEHILKYKAMGATGVITNYPTELKRIAYPPPPERDWNSYMKDEPQKDAYRFSGKI